MKAFACQVCGQFVVFENSVCVSCGTSQGFEPSAGRLVPVPGDGSLVPCTGLATAQCNWLVPAPEVVPYNGLCASCRLTRGSR